MPSWTHSQTFVSAHTYDCTPAVSQNTNNYVLLDSGASCHASRIPHTNLTLTHTTFLNADGRQLTPLGTLTTTADLGTLEASHNFIVVKKLSIPAILGCDFLSKHFETKQTSQIRTSLPTFMYFWMMSIRRLYLPLVIWISFWTCHHPAVFHVL